MAHWNLTRRVETWGEKPRRFSRRQNPKSAGGKACQSERIVCHE